MKRFDKVKIKAMQGLKREHRQFAGMDAVVMKIEGNMITLAIDHDGDASTEPIMVTIQSNYIETMSVLWGLWLAVKRLFRR